MHHDWIEEIESAEPSAPQQRAGLALGVPLVAAALGIALGGIGASLWWAQRGRTVAEPVAKVSTLAPTTVASVAAVVAPPTVQITPATAASAAAVTQEIVAVPREEEAAVERTPPAAGPPALSPEEVARRKERAWARFYKRPATCDGNPSADQLIECGNHFIRAKREFDERWRTGNL
jgi:hypothetical protein